MITTQTLTILESLLSLSFEMESMSSWVNRRRCIEQHKKILSAETLQALTDAVKGLKTQVSRSLVEGLRQTDPSFADTPFAGKIDRIVTAYETGTAAGRSIANFELDSLIRSADDWLKELHEASLQRHNYTVGSAYGEFEVLATSPEKARAIAAAAHFRCREADLDDGHMRAFANGVLA